LKVDPSLIHRLFYPQVPAVFASQLRGRVSAMPVVSYASVSTSPPLVAVACNPDSYTCKLALKAGAFSLSLLDRSKTSAIDGLATTHGKSVKDKLASVGLRHSRGVKLNVPAIEGARATLECSVSSKSKTGDHTLVIGLVSAAYATSAFSDFWNFRRYKPLLYTGWKDGLTTYDGP
jgi:3-hydroxy-9,10-secoandrosta-1,3,5(10)-triene-9,17-dione monooxygenase reductase component